MWSAVENKVKIEQLWKRLEIEGVAFVVRRGRLRWFGHVEGKIVDDLGFGLWSVCGRWRKRCW